VQVASIMNVLQSTVASAERVFELLDEEEEVPDVDNPVVLEDVKGMYVSSTSISAMIQMFH